MIRKKELLILFVVYTNSLHANEDYHNVNIHSLQRLWGIPDTTANIGYYFNYKIPNDAFDGKIGRYKAVKENGGPLPEWLTFDEKNGVLEGLPTDEDIGEDYISVKAFDSGLRDSVKDVFAIEILSVPPESFIAKNDCNQQMDQETIFSLVLDLKISKLKADQRVNLIKTAANLFNLSVDAIRLRRMEDKDEPSFNSYSYISAAGPGNIKQKSSQESTVLQFQIGCNDEIYDKFTNFIDNIRKIGRNGTLSKLLMQPIVGWTLRTDEIVGNKNRNKIKRDVVSPLNGGLFHLQNLGDDSGLGAAGVDEGIPEQRVVVPNTVTPAFTLDPSPELLSTNLDHHHHRHHHGDTLLPYPWPSPSSVLPSLSILPTPTYIPDRPIIDKSDVLISEDLLPTLSVPSPEPSSLSYTKENEITDYGKWSSGGGFESESEIGGNEEPTPPLTNITSTVTDDTIISLGNQPPAIVHRLQKVAVTAGKILRYQIPENTFMDAEDGNTRNLKLHLQTSNGEILPENSWIQLDEENQEIYALPLEEHVSKWNFIILARDSGGLSVEDRLDLSVQQHKGSRNVNHLMKATIQSVPRGPSLNWQVAFTERIAQLYNDEDTNKITVLEISHYNPPPAITFTWTNDTLSASTAVSTACPTKQIQQIYQIANADGGLKESVVEGLVINDIKWIGTGQCEQATRYPYLPPKSTTNFAPVPRNQVDHLNATVGQLLIFPVPEDSFYDPEDGNTRNMKLSLITMDRQRVPPNHWLRFDSKNQEFYGIPMSVNVGQMEYQLVCEDSGGKTAVDGLVVIVHPAPRILYNVEFSIRLALDYNQFVESPPMQRSFVERLATLFGDANTQAIVLSGFAPGSTIITWHNKSLPTDACPDTEIIALRQVLLGDDERITPAVLQALGSQFPVIGARLTPTGLCLGALTEISGAGDNGGAGIGGDSIDGTGRHDVTAISHGEQYIIGLVIPAIVIAVMLACAGLVACVLYRRRTTGKLSVRDDDDRQTFRSKGIPVIFQDELDERPEPTNKSPVIMKEEKPPAPPPEYQRGGGGGGGAIVATSLSATAGSNTCGGSQALATTALLSDTEDSTPYQPPPPFTTSRDSGRPKPTPTYRMPPPYVPP
ncbi:hypothetical protein O3M35_004548 [Rhynocoris fuscipes]|uniref:Dystroglycan 1 n=1 Tax=Rhynocoris fuscipes TaxID=488301 RepID=A0AAW1CHY5_9HEMI